MENCLGIRKIPKKYEKSFLLSQLFKLWMRSDLSEFFNSSTAIAGAIIGLLLVFYNSKNLNCIGALSFYDWKRSPFFNQFYWSDFWSGKWNAWKKLEWFWCWTKVKSGAKREVFVHTAVFERARNWCVKKFSLSERNFFVHVRHFKAVFFFISFD